MNCPPARITVQQFEQAEAFVSDGKRSACEEPLLRNTANRNLTPSDAHLLTLAQSISLFGTSLTWTGFPVLVATETGDYRTTSLLFFTSSLATVLAALGLTKFADRLKGKSTFVFGSALSCSLLVSMYLLGNSDLTPFVLLAIALSAIDTLINTSLAVWHTQVCEHTNTNIRKAIAGQSLGQIVAKMLGMSAGPLHYQTIGTTGLLIDGATSLVQGILVLSVPHLGHKVHNHLPVSKIEALRPTGLRSVRRHTIAFTSLVAEMTRVSVPVTTILLIQKFSSGAVFVSTAWLLGLLGGLAGSLFLMGGRAGRCPDAGLAWTSVLLCLAAVALIGLEAVVALCMAMGVFSAGNVLFQVPLTALVRTFKPESERGRFISFNAAMAGIGGLMGTSVSSLMADKISHSIFALCIMVLLRAILMATLTRMSEKS